MDAGARVLSAVGGLLHRHLLALIVASYVLAAAAPGVGLRVKEARVVDLAVGPVAVRAKLPAVLLGFLLFGAGLRARAERVRQVVRRPSVVLAGLAANTAVPLVYLLALLPVLHAWHSDEEAATVVVGLALVAAMPIAGSSTGWAQKAGGDMALSLGLVLASTLLSPVTTPAVLELLGRLAPGGAAEQLRLVSGRETGAFLATWVLVPSLLGMAVRRVVHAPVREALERALRPLASLTLLVLCYANASACLPAVFRGPDWDFLGIVTGAVVGLCLATFAAGYALGHVLGVDREQHAALVFGLGMNNNGTGLVLASVALAAYPVVLLPIIVYNLAQHLAAGCADAFFRRRTVAPAA